MKRGFAWSATDQIASGLSNFLIVVLLARVSSPRDFGLFVTVWVGLSFLQICQRNFLALPLSLASGDRVGLLKQTRLGLKTLLFGAPIPPFVILAIAWFAGVGGTRIWLLAFATPFVLAQDLLRHAAVAFQKERIAAISDLVWLSLSGMAVVDVLLQLTGFDPMLYWTAGALTALFILWGGLRVELTESWSSSADSASIDLRGRMSLGGAALTGQASNTVVPLMITTWAGPEITGVLGALAQLMVPVNSMLGFMNLAVVSFAARQSEGKRPLLYAAVGSGVAVISISWGFLLSFTPDWVGRELLGRTWEQAGPLVLLYGFATSLVALGAAAGLLLASQQASSALLKFRTGQAALRVGLVFAALLHFQGRATARDLILVEGLILLGFALIAWLDAGRRVRHR